MTEFYSQKVNLIIVLVTVLFALMAFVFVIFSEIKEPVKSPISALSVSSISTSSQQEGFAVVSPSNVYKAQQGFGAEMSSNFFAMEPGYKKIDSRMFPKLIEVALNHPRKRRMNDFTEDATHNSLQTLLNTWTDGSYSPVHKHYEYAETFVALDGALAFFTFSDKGDVHCHILGDGKTAGSTRAIIIEKNEWHAMCAAPKALGYPGYAVVFETSGHFYNASAPTKVLAPFAPVNGDGLNGDNQYFEKILKSCPQSQKD